MRGPGCFGAVLFFTFALLACIGASTVVSVLTTGEPARPPVFGFFISAIGLLALLLGGAGVFYVAGTFRKAARPINELIDATERVERGDFSVRVTESGPSTLRALARTFNSMAERLQQNEATRRNLLADVTHELRTPLTIIQGNLEGVLDGIYPRDDAHLAPILEETRVMSRLIDDLRTLSLAEAGALPLQKEPTDLSALARDVAAAFAAPAKQAQVQLIVNASEPVMADVDALRIRAVLNNLIANALRYTPAGGTITVGVAHSLEFPSPTPPSPQLPQGRSASPEGRGSRSVRIEVIDTGSGIAPADLPHVFDRFYKGRDSSGSGLGLAIAKQLVQAHAGEIHAESDAGAGTRIWFTLPINEQPV
jgi:signal transduction histidine kinase